MVSESFRTAILSCALVFFAVASVAQSTDDDEWKQAAEAQFQADLEILLALNVYLRRLHEAQSLESDGANDFVLVVVDGCLLPLHSCKYLEKLAQRFRDIEINEPVAAAVVNVAYVDIFAVSNNQDSECKRERPGLVSSPIMKSETRNFVLMSSNEPKNAGCFIRDLGVF